MDEGAPGVAGGLSEPPPATSSTRRGRVAALLRDLRARTEHDQAAFGALVGGLSQPKVSRLETGRQVPSLELAAAWADAADADMTTRERLLEWTTLALNDARPRVGRQPQSVAAIQDEIAGHEQAASVVRAHTVIVPGLLQTAEYTRRFFEMQAALQPAAFPDIAEGRAAWARRQRILYEPGHTFEYVLPEAALRFRPGPDDSPRMMLAQLGHLASLSTLDSVRLGIIPWRRAVRVCPTHDFTIMGEPGVDEDVSVEIYTTTQSLHIRDEQQVAVYRELFDRLSADAVFEDDARGLIRTVAAEIQSEIQA
jgi:hypothetical protein